MHVSTSFQKMYDTPGAFFVEHVPRDARDVLRASIIELILGMFQGWGGPHCRLTTSSSPADAAD